MQKQTATLQSECLEASGCSHARQLAELPEEARGEWICKAAEMGISIRQLARITGISKGIIERERQRM